LTKKEIFRQSEYILVEEHDSMEVIKAKTTWSIPTLLSATWHIKQDVCEVNQFVTSLGL